MRLVPLGYHRIAWRKTRKRFVLIYPNMYIEYDQFGSANYIDARLRSVRQNITKIKKNRNISFCYKFYNDINNLVYCFYL